MLQDRQGERVNWSRSNKTVSVTWKRVIMCESTRFVDRYAYYYYFNFFNLWDCFEKVDYIVYILLYCFCVWLLGIVMLIIIISFVLTYEIVFKRWTKFFLSVIVGRKKKLRIIFFIYYCWEKKKSLGFVSCFVVEEWGHFWLCVLLSLLLLWGSCFDLALFVRFKNLVLLIHDCIMVTH